MKTLKKLCYISLGIMLLLSSCSIEKRQYLSGYNIEWKNLRSNADKKELASNDGKPNFLNNKLPSQAITSNNADEILIASTENVIALQSPIKIFAVKKENKNLVQSNTVSEKKVNTINEQTVFKKSENKNKPKPRGGDHTWYYYGFIIFLVLLCILFFYMSNA